MATAKKLSISSNLTTSKLNVLPSSTLNKSVEVYTVNNVTQEEFNEDFIVEPHALMTTISSKKAVISLGGSEGYALKFTFPGASIAGYSTERNKIYVTFCMRNAAYEDGYQDFSTLTQAYIDRLVVWLWSQIRPGVAQIKGEYTYTMYLNVRGEGTLGLISLPIKFYFVIDEGVTAVPTIGIINPATRQAI